MQIGIRIDTFGHIYFLLHTNYILSVFLLTKNKELPLLSLRFLRLNWYVRYVCNHIYVQRTTTLSKQVLKEIIAIENKTERRSWLTPCTYSTACARKQTLFYFVFLLIGMLRNDNSGIICMYSEQQWIYQSLFPKKSQPSQTNRAEIINYTLYIPAARCLLGLAERLLRNHDSCLEMFKNSPCKNCMHVWCPHALHATIKTNTHYFPRL